MMRGKQSGFAAGPDLSANEPTVSRPAQKARKNWWSSGWAGVLPALQEKRTAYYFLAAKERYVPSEAVILSVLITTSYATAFLRMLK